MPIFKRCSRCKKRIPSGSICECNKLRYKDYDKFSRDVTSDKFYHGGKWRSTRQDILDLDKMDVYLYITTGEIVIADTVHHVIPLKDDWDKRYDIDNLMSLSHDTHSMIENMYKVDKDGTIKILKEMLGRYRERCKIR